MTSNDIAPAAPAELSDQELLRTYGLAKRDYCYEGDADDWPRKAKRASTLAGLRAAIAADRASQPAPAEPVELTDFELETAYQSAYQPSWELSEYCGVNLDGLRAVAAAALAKRSLPADGEVAGSRIPLHIAITHQPKTTPPAPVEPPASVDLDTLLSPAGPYETGPDAGNAPGAQLVTGRHGPTWWAPVYDSDSLSDLLDQIRSRILPHLRPPVVGIDIPGPDGDWGDIADLCQAEGVDVEAGARLLRRVRAAWHPAWYQAQPTPPAEGEVGELVAALKGDAACIEAGQHDLCSSTADQLTRAAELLQQQADELATLRRQAGPPAEEEAWSVAESVRRRSAQNPMGSADPTLIHAAELLERLAGELATLRQLAEEILALVSESTGVAGLHLNGDIAPWDELLPGGRFERLTSLPLEDRPHG